MVAVKSEHQMQRLEEKSVGEANGEVSSKGFQWKEKMGHKRGESGDGKLLERVR